MWQSGRSAGAFAFTLLSFPVLPGFVFLLCDNRQCDFPSSVRRAPSKRALCGCGLFSFYLMAAFRFLCHWECSIHVCPSCSTLAMERRILKGSSLAFFFVKLCRRFLTFFYSGIANNKRILREYLLGRKPILLIGPYISEGNGTLWTSTNRSEAAFRVETDFLWRSSRSCNRKAGIWSQRRLSEPQVRSSMFNSPNTANFHSNVCYDKKSGCVVDEDWKQLVN